MTKPRATAAPVNPPAGDRLHGVTLAVMLEMLLTRYGWEGLAQRIDIRCFKSDPSVKSSLTFLRRTPWARAQLEALYLDDSAALPGVTDIAGTDRQAVIDSVRK